MKGPVANRQTDMRTQSGAAFIDQLNAVILTIPPLVNVRPSTRRRPKDKLPISAANIAGLDAVLCARAAEE